MSGNGNPDNLNLADMPAPPEGMPVLVANELRAAATSVLLERMQFMRQAGLSFGGERDMYAVLGYDRLITVRQFRDRYYRGGIAGTVVDVMPDATWRGEMWLEEDEDPEVSTPFEQAWEELDQRLQVQSRLLQVDKLSRLSTYAVLLLGAGGNYEEELPKATKPEDLVFLKPYLGAGGPGGNTTHGTMVGGGLETSATIFEYDTDVRSPRFGEPLSYQIRNAAFSSAELQRPVHWSRVIHVAEGCLEDDVFGQPALERIWNLLDDLDKVTGGGSEAFWLRANQGLHLDIDKDMSLPSAKDAVAALKEQAEDYKHQLTRWLRTRGVNVQTLGSDVANFANPADAVLTQIAGAKRIPKRILTGSEMGELASSQDRENFKDQVDGRQKQYAGPYIVRRLIDRLIRYSYLPMPKGGANVYEVKWPHVQTMTEDEKARGAQTWAATATPEGPVYTRSEIRDKWYGLQPLSPEQLEEMQPPAPEAPEPAPGEEEQVIEDEKFAAAEEHRYASTQVQIPPGIAKRMLAFAASIPDADLAEDGREDDPHVTVKYGLHAEEADGPVRELLEDSSEVRVVLGRLRTFEADGYDVLYVEVDSPDLRRLNSRISTELEVTDTHPKYTPHATIAYVQKGRADDWVGDDRFAGLEFVAKTVEFRGKDERRERIPLGLRAAEEAEMLRVLQDAIEAGNAEVVTAIVGLRA